MDIFEVLQDTDTRIKVFSQTGECLLNIKEVDRKWTSNTYISRYDKKYVLTEFDVDGNRLLHVNISKEQAKEIITCLNLRKGYHSGYPGLTLWHS